MDRRRRQYAPLSVRFAHDEVGTAVLKALGHSGLLAWVGMIAAAKRSPVQGQLEFFSDEDAWRQLGVHIPAPPAFALDELLSVLGRMKQTRKRRSGGVLYVTLTNYGKWNEKPRTYAEAERKSRKRRGNTADEAKRNRATTADDAPSEGEGEGEGEQTLTRLRSTNPIWDELASELGEPATPDERKRRGRVVAQLRAADATAEQVRERCKRWRHGWPSMTLTDTALVKHWTTLATLEPKSNGHRADALLAEARADLAWEREAIGP